MMTQCPQCGSTEIIPDLIVFTDETTGGHKPAHVKLLEPEPAKRPFVWIPKEVTSGFRAAVCGACGHTQLYAANHAEILESHKKGYTGKTYSLNMIAIP